MPRSPSINLEILVVDDEPLVREVVAGNLQEKFPGFRIRQADSGNAALAIINERVPDLILVDLRMPGLNGFALTRMLRSRDRTRNLPVIVVSGLSDTPSVLKALELGATDYCVKPIDFELLVRKVGVICSRILNNQQFQTRNRSAPRRRIYCHTSAGLLVSFPEREGLWVESSFNVGEGEPLQIDGSKIFQALRLHLDSPLWWSRVEHCVKETDGYRLKLLLDPLPQRFDEQIQVLSRSKERFRRYFGGGQEPLTVDVPCVIQNLSGGGLQIAGTLPWKVDSGLQLDLSELVHRLGITAPETKALVRVRWTRPEGKQYVAGVRFEEIEENMRLQLMAHCLRGVSPPEKPRGGGALV